MTDSNARILAYAREHGLAVPDLFEDDLLHHCEPRRVDDALGPYPSHGILEQTTQQIIGEKLILYRDEVELLRYACSSHNVSSAFWESLDARQSRHLKLEDVVLRSDPKYDLSVFKQSIKEPDADFALPRLNTESSEYLPIDIAQNVRRNSLDERLAGERLVVDKSALLFLKDILTPVSITAELAQILQDEVSANKRALMPVTSPLLPVSDSPDCYNGSMSPLDFEIEDMEAQFLTSCELSENLELGLLKDDAPTSFDMSFFNEQSNSSAITRNHQRLNSDQLDTDINLKQAGDFYLETPLMPLDDRSSTADSITPSTLLALDGGIVQWPKAKSDLDSDEEYNKIFDQVINPAATAVNQILMHEAPTIPESSFKITVPEVTVYVPDVPWRLDQCGKSISENIRNFMLPIAKLSLHHWSKPMGIDRELTWVPLSSKILKTVSIEVFEPLFDISSYLEKSPMLSDDYIQNLIWKPNGLRLLEPRECDDDELLPASPDSNIASLARKRKFELMSCEYQRSSSENSIPQVAERSVLQRVEIQDEEATDHVKPYSAFFSTTSSLDRFLDLKGHVRKRPRLEPSAQIKTGMPSDMITARTDLSQAQTDQESSSHIAPIFAIPTAPKVSRPLVVDSALLLQADFAKTLTAMEPDINIIERQSKDREVQADLILSPSTGCLLTTNQRIKQKSLPGSNSLPPFYAKVRSCLAKYERLIVLSSCEDFSSLANDQREGDAILDLHGFAASQDGNVEVYVIAGGMKQLVPWILQIASTLPPLPREFKLLPEETLWELFLRKAGLNPFAAQAILSEVKAPYIEDAESAAHARLNYGLAAFVRMSASERAARFTALLGGSRVLDQVGRFLDTDWGRVMCLSKMRDVENIE